MDKDEYNEIINGKNTYRVIYTKLSNFSPVIISWTDEKDTALTILFTSSPYRDYENILRFGLQDWYLYISIIGIGAFGFNSKSIKDSGYIAEKLNIKDEYTAEKLTELINGVINYRKDTKNE